MDSFKTRNKLLPPGAEIKEYETRILGFENKPTYQSIKKNFSADKNSAHDSRFILSEMVHNNLSVEAEEERRFEERVQLELSRLRDEVKNSAHDEGYEDGLKKGLQKAYDEEKSRLAALIEGLSHALGTITQAKENLAQNYESRLVELAYKMATVIVDHEIKNRPESVSNSIRMILEKISQDEDVRIHVATADHEALSEIEDELSSVSHRGRISFTLDPNLSSGDCIVEAASGEIASLIQEKFKKLSEELDRIYPGFSSDSSVKTGT